MKSKLKCPFCGKTLRKSQYIEPLTGQNLYFCDTHDCYPTECVIGTQSMWQALNESHQATLTNAHTALEFKKDLEIATEALKEIKKVCDGCRWCDSNLYDPTPNDGRRIAETTNNALKQIEHKESE